MNWSISSVILTITGLLVLGLVCWRFSGSNEAVLASAYDEMQKEDINKIRQANDSEI